MYWWKDCKPFPGVSGIQIWGEKRYAMRIWFNPDKLTAYKLNTSWMFRMLYSAKTLNCLQEKSQVMQQNFRKNFWKIKHRRRIQ